MFQAQLLDSLEEDEHVNCASVDAPQVALYRLTASAVFMDMPSGDQLRHAILARQHPAAWTVGLLSKCSLRPTTHGLRAFCQGSLRPLPRLAASEEDAFRGFPLGLCLGAGRASRAVRRVREVGK